MAKNKVNLKQLAIETYYGKLNITLELLNSAITQNNKEEIDNLKKEVLRLKNILTKLNYFKE